MRTLRFLPLLGSTLLTASALAQAPQGFSYQAVARDQFGTAVSGQPIGVQFVLHQGNALGAVVYAETHGTSTNANGLFTLTVGQGATGTGTFSAIDWSDGPYFLEVAMDLSGLGSYTSIGTQQLMSVPYALYAGKSNVPDGTEVGQILHWDGNAWVADSGLYVHQRRFGIGTLQPDAPLSIKADGLAALLNAKSAANFNPTEFRLAFSGPDTAGLDFEEVTALGNESRLYIAPVTGNVGLGTTDPEARVHVRGTSGGVGSVVWRL